MIAFWKRNRKSGHSVGITDNPNDPALSHGVDAEPTGQAEKYLVLSQDERNKGFVRPLRTSYQHESCGTVTHMNQAIAETYARNPGFYGATYCCGCRKHLSVAEFFWLESRDGAVTDQRVGS